MLTNTFDFKLTVVGPPEWLTADNQATTHVRLKLENGIVFLKPVRIDEAKRGRQNDVLEIVERQQGFAVTSILPADYPMWDRVVNYLHRRGWSYRQSFFALHAGFRGWYSLTLAAADAPPPDGEAYVIIAPICEVVQTVSYDLVKQVVLATMQNQHRAA